ncbi:hypothetical protein [Nocardiopsis halophila]|uniref:hypothetical protein n=1 Tax=Nocardiopsis halophila TaxID=141692 RepID=UPI000349BDD6|nr:hypothetical protein [Nocardiopsis halophila]
MDFTREQVAPRDKHRWRLQAARALTTLEEEAAAADLPVLDWSVTGRTLAGRPAPTTDARQAVEAWCDHLDGERDAPAALAE